MHMYLSISVHLYVNLYTVIKTDFVHTVSLCEAAVPPEIKNIGTKLKYALMAGDMIDLNI